MKTGTLKGEIIERQVKMIEKRFSKDVEKMIDLLHGDMYELRYRLYNEKWKFDKEYTHPLVNVSGLGDRTVDKKSDLYKFCVSITNQSITPYNNDITFIINSQHVFDKNIVLGLCHRKTLMNMDF